MALGKEITNSVNGVVCGYWRIESVNIDVLNMRASFGLRGYVSKAIRELARGRPVESRNFTVRGEVFLALAKEQATGNLFDAIRAPLYRFIKSPLTASEEVGCGEFIDAQDV